MTEKLPILSTLREAGRLVVHHRNDLLRVGFVFILGFFATGAIVFNFLWPLATGSQLDSSGQLIVDPRLPAGVLLTLVIEFLLFSVFAVGWHRVILLGPDHAGHGLGVQLGGRELRYFGRLWLCFVGSFAIAFVVTFVEQMIGRAMAGNPANFMLGAETAYMLVSAYIFGRLAPCFAALSIDRKFGFVQSWKATQGNGLRIFAIYALIAAGWLGTNLIVGAFLRTLGLDNPAPYTLLLVGALALCAVFALLVTVNAIVYRRLAGMRVPP